MENNMYDYGKQISDKIPDIAFDWYARLIPGVICIMQLVLLGKIELEFISENLLIILLIAYMIGHVIQPFSSGILQRKYPNLRGKKDPLLSKAYSELVGFFSCLILAIVILIFEIYCLFFTNNARVMIEFSFVVLFLFAVKFRIKAYNRKYEDQIKLTSKVTKSKKTYKINNK